VTSNNPVPTISGLAPTTTTVGTTTTFAITGTNFVPGASVRVTVGVTVPNLSRAAGAFHRGGAGGRAGRPAEARGTRASPRSSTARATMAGARAP